MLLRSKKKHENNLSLENYAPYDEVADVLELSVPAVKSRLHRARLFLRDKLTNYFYKWRK